MSSSMDWIAIQVFICVGVLCSHVSSVEVGGGDENGSNPVILSTAQNIILALSVLCTLVLVVFSCTVAWWRRVFCFWRKTGSHEAPDYMFEPNGGPPTFETLDPRSLGGRGGRQSVTIESLPTLNDLGLDGRSSFELRNLRPPSIVSVSSSTNNLGLLDVQDWFEDPHTSFPRKNLEYQQIIGKGWFGKVLEAEAKEIKQYVRNSNVIVRELRNNATEDDQRRFLSEAKMYREAQGQRCDYVLKLLGFCVDQLPYILIFEYFPLGDLKSYLKQRAKQAPGQLKVGEDGLLTRMIIDIIRGVKWMEQAGFIHGDLSARNCLVATPAGKVVIGDYGFSTQKFKSDYYWSSATGSAIPIRWAAPETLAVEDPPGEYGSFTSSAPSSSTAGTQPIIKPLEITSSANIWTLAVVIWEIFQFGKLPYDNLTDEDVIRRVIKQKSFILEPPQLPFVKNETKDKIYQLLASCWNSSSGHRPSIDAIEQFFTTPTPT